MAEITASMAGTVLTVHVSVGDEITAGQDVVTLESMKMEVPVTAEQGGKVAKVHVNAGDFVNEGDTLLETE